jgi:hypothetical protein
VACLYTRDFATAHLTEITVKYIKTKDSSKMKVKANISGRKILLFPRNTPSKVNVIPLFDETDVKFENSRRVVGFRIVLGDSALVVENPDFSEEAGSIKSSQGNWSRTSAHFNYTNKFTNTRFNYLSGPYQDAYICEVWFKAELTQYADHELTRFFGP